MVWFPLINLTNLLSSLGHMRHRSVPLRLTGLRFHYYVRTVCAFEWVLIWHKCQKWKCHWTKNGKLIGSRSCCWGFLEKELLAKSWRLKRLDYPICPTDSRLLWKCWKVGLIFLCIWIIPPSRSECVTEAARVSLLSKTDLYVIAELKNFTDLKFLPSPKNILTFTILINVISPLLIETVNPVIYFRGCHWTRTCRSYIRDGGDENYWKTQEYYQFNRSLHTGRLVDYSTPRKKVFSPLVGRDVKLNHDSTIMLFILRSAVCCSGVRA